MMMRALWIHASYPGDSRQCSIGTRERFFHVPAFKGVVHLIQVAHCLKGDGTRNPPLQGALGNPSQDRRTMVSARDRASPCISSFDQDGVRARSRASRTWTRSLLPSFRSIVVKTRVMLPGERIFHVVSVPLR